MVHTVQREAGRKRGSSGPRAILWATGGAEDDQVTHKGVGQSPRGHSLQPGQSGLGPGGQGRADASDHRLDVSCGQEDIEWAGGRVDVGQQSRTF